ncbi:NAD(P)H-binding protein [Frankia sp. AgPm24]|uniref:NAD(P)H-binding protein n=1 Tax=Frankia sp. AgPm24 TaxID=631128 RepID=UPI00200FCF2F|nr:NAD(P)H-binding protein [Frankia sp. AgPm24]
MLVTGATGTVGSQVVRQLRRRQVAVRAFVRDADRAASQFGSDGDGVRWAVGDLSDPASVRRAMRGVDRVFLSTANSPAQQPQETTVIDAAAAGWVKRIVKLSALGAQIGAPQLFLDAHGRIEQQLATCGVPSVVLRPAFFMSNLFALAEPVRTSGTLFAAAGDARIAMIDPADVAAAGVAALLAGTGPDTNIGGQAHEGRTHVLTGPQAITFADVGVALTTATGREVRYTEVSDQAARAALLGLGAPAWLADNVVMIYALLRQGHAEHTSNAVQALTGRPPRTIAEFAAEHRAAFAR